MPTVWRCGGSFLLASCGGASGAAALGWLWDAPPPQLLGALRPIHFGVGVIRDHSLFGAAEAWALGPSVTTVLNPTVMNVSRFTG